MPRNRL